MYRYSMTQWIVGDEEIEYSFQRLKKYGYDGIEFAAESALLDADRLSELMKQYGISCTSLSAVDISCLALSCFAGASWINSKNCSMHSLGF